MTEHRTLGRRFRHHRPDPCQLLGAGICDETISDHDTGHDALDGLEPIGGSLRQGETCESRTC